MNEPIIKPPTAQIGSETVVGERSMVQLDGLRAMAVAAVAWSHWAPQKWLFGLPWGTGVLLFFVISGFLITGILLDHRPSENASKHARFKVWRRFYLRRALRIFPLFYLVLALALAFNVGNLRSVWPWHFGYLSNVYYFLGHPHDSFAHFWSLAVEEQFYLVWPFLMLLLPVRKLYGWIILMILAAPLSRVLITAVSPESADVRFLACSCLDSLGIGALLATTQRFAIGGKWDAHFIAKWCLLVGLPICLIGTSLEALASPPYWVKSVSHTGLTLFYGWVVFKGAEGFAGGTGRLLRSSVLTYLGRISYGIYVYHFFAPTIFRPLGGDEFFLDRPVLRLASFAALTLALAATSWRFYENPLNRLKRFVPYE